jgi:hypothetical protein
MATLPQSSELSGRPAARPPAPRPTRRSGLRAVMYPSTYLWYVLVSTLDLMFTRVMLHFGGEEMNVIANYVLGRWNIAGVVLFKFALVFTVICICEFVGRRRPRAGLYLIQWAVGITWIPVLLSILLLLTEPAIR